MKTSLIIMLLIFLTPALTAVKVKHLKSIALSQADDILIRKANSFVVTEDNQILVVDTKAADLKIFDMTGKRLQVFGRKGMGPDEFVRPRRIAYSKPYVLLVDFGRKTIFVYKRTPQNGLEFVKKFLCMYLGHGFYFIDHKNILIAGDKFDDKQVWHKLYRYNLEDGSTKCLLPVDTAFELSSVEQFKKEVAAKLQYIGLGHFVDFSEESFFWIWMGDTSVVKIDRKSGKISRFGKRTDNFAKPYAKPEMIKAYHNMNHRESYKHERDFSMVRDIFVTSSNTVGVVYVGPYKKNNSLPV
ncbi:MAG: 6-bladed beta-propeller, partial [bacterium]|nr:6-bladed beta-propeller [bacterium]